MSSFSESRAAERRGSFESASDFLRAKASVRFLSGWTNWSGGVSCLPRVIAAPQVRSALLEQLTARAEGIKVGPGLDDSVHMGPAVDEKQWRQDLDYIEVAKQAGARLVTGGRRPTHLEGGYFVAPTIFDQVDPASRLFREEVFGPVSCLMFQNRQKGRLGQVVSNR